MRSPFRIYLTSEDKSWSIDSLLIQGLRDGTIIRGNFITRDLPSIYELCSCDLILDKETDQITFHHIFVSPGPTIHFSYWSNSNNKEAWSQLEEETGLKMIGDLRKDSKYPYVLLTIDSLWAGYFPYGD